MEPSAAPAEDKTQPKAKAKAAPSQTTPKERGRGRGRGGGGRESAAGRAGGRESAGRAADPDGFTGVCYFFQEGTCKRGADCRFEHRKLSKKQFEKMPKPSAANRSSSPQGKGGKGRGKGRSASRGRSGSNDKDRPKPKAKAKAGSRLSKLWCAAFLKGDCKHGESCNFPHLDQAAVDKIKKALGNNRGS